MGKSYEEIMELAGKAVEVTYENSKSTAVILKRLEDQDKLLGGLSNTVATIGQDVNKLGDEINQLKLNEEITTEQSETLRACAEKRVIEILGNDALERKKYFTIFVRRLYGDTKRNAGLGSKIDRTRKGNFQRCIDYIEAWIPSCGCAELRAKADANAKARLEARELGYTD